MKQLNQISKTLKKHRRAAVVTVAVLVITLVGMSYFEWQNGSNNKSTSYNGHGNSSANNSDETLPPIPDNGALATQARTTEDNLKFLIEEEKLAHDVYVALGDKWGSQTFDNITRSESTHQSRVLTLLNTRSIKDPRTSTPGTFSNSDLQKLYDDLMDKGLRSSKDAYEVGVLIEQTDIADINTMLKTEKDTDVIDVLNALKNGSYNHLRAFSRH